MPNMNVLCDEILWIAARLAFLRLVELSGGNCRLGSRHGGKYMDLNSPRNGEANPFVMGAQVFL